MSEVSQTNTEITTIPVKTKKLRRYESNTPFPLPPPELIAPVHEPNPSLPTKWETKPTSLRSAQLKSVEAKVLWGGEYPADLYGSFDDKGVNSQAPIIQYDPYTPYKLRVYGLKERTSISNITMMSELFRDRGLPTEHPLSWESLDHVILTDQHGRNIPVTLDVWKQLTTDRLKKMKIRNEKVDGKVDPDFAIRWVEQLELVIERRELQLSLRLRDLAQEETVDGLKSALEKPFAWLNTVFREKGFNIIPGTPPPAQPFTSSEVDIFRYLVDWIPNQLGTYLAKMHKQNLIHRFPHTQNWTAAGTLVDLDSAMINFGDHEDVYRSRDCSVTFTSLEELYRGKGASKICGESKYAGLANFIQAYVNHYEGTQDKTLKFFLNPLALDAFDNLGGYMKLLFMWPRVQAELRKTKYDQKK